MFGIIATAIQFPFFCQVGNIETVATALKIKNILLSKKYYNYTMKLLYSRSYESGITITK